MQIQQIKSNFLKGKANMSDKKEIFKILKPCEEVVKEIINLS